MVFLSYPQRFYVYCLFCNWIIVNLFIYIHLYLFPRMTRQVCCYSQFTSFFSVLHKILTIFANSKQALLFIYLDITCGFFPLFFLRKEPLSSFKNPYEKLKTCDLFVYFFFCCCFFLVISLACVFLSLFQNAYAVFCLAFNVSLSLCLCQHHLFV